MSIETNETVSHRSWKDWLNSRESAVSINQGHQERLFEIFNHSISTEKCRSELEGHGETVFLFRQSFGDRRVNLFHHMKKVGGTLYVAKEDFGFIQGVEEGATCFMTPDYDVLTRLPQDEQQAVPTAAHLLAVTSIEEVDALVPGTRSWYTPRNFVPVPPFLIDSISKSISTAEGDSNQALVDAVKSIKDFDTTHSNDAEYRDKAKSKCKDFLAWLFLVGKNGVEATPTMGCNNREMIEMLKSIESTALVSKNHGVNELRNNDLEKILKRPLEILASTSSSTHDFMHKLTQIQAQASDKYAKSFKKVAPKYQKMLLIASSQGEVVPGELGKPAMEFFQQSSVLNAQIFLNSFLESERIECAVSSALTTALMHGSFLWASSLTPSGLASSVISSLDIIRTDTLHEGIVLDYSTRHEMTSNSLEKLTKTQILFPTDVDASIERLRALEALVRLFLGKISIAQQGLKRLVNLCLDNKQLLKTKNYLDEMFIPKLHFSVDDRLNQWLRQCCRAEDVLETNTNLVDFPSIFYDIQLNKFHCALPPTIMKLKKSEEESSGVSQDKELHSVKKKKKQVEQERNLDPVHNWKMRLDERWDTVFKNKTKDGPTLSVGGRPCLKWHCKLFCYNDCRNKASHRVLVGNDKLKTEQFIKSIRGE